MDPFTAIRDDLDDDERAEFDRIVAEGRRHQKVEKSIAKAEKSTAEHGES